ncbi:MAG: hypothetical protein SNJ77_09890, partial [Cytophagales bacterium]
LKSEKFNHHSKFIIEKYPQNAFSIYLSNLEEVLGLFMLDDEKWFQSLKKNESERLKSLENLKDKNPFTLYFQAEIKIHWAVLKMKFGDELGAAWSLRQAFFLLEKLVQQHPDFYLAYKSLGLLHVLIGTIPTKYHWVVNLMGLKGTVSEGLKEMLMACNQAPSLFQEESCLTLVLVDAFVLKKTEASVSKVENMYLKNPENDLLKLVLAAMYLNNRQSAECFSLLNEKIDALKLYSKPYALRMLGDANLYKGEYTASIKNYQNFLKSYQGQNYLKDAYFKIYLGYWLQNQSETANTYIEKIKKEGKSTLDTDKRALSFAQKPEKYHKDLMRFRLMYDGGYNKEAIQEMTKIKVDELKSPVFQNEYFYRLGRLYHAIGKIPSAKENYIKCIETNPKNEDLYYAPNSAYSLGLIFEEENDLPKAKFYFQKAISFKNHEYKNSIDNKSKARLEKLEKSTKP